MPYIAGEAMAAKKDVVVTLLWYQVEAIIWLTGREGLFGQVGLTVAHIEVFSGTKL